jgi:hypothetical protein
LCLKVSKYFHVWRDKTIAGYENGSRENAQGIIA